jgi:hypothetical protein
MPTRSKSALNAALVVAFQVTLTQGHLLAQKATCASCPVKVDPRGTQSLGTGAPRPSKCHVQMSNGFPIPDPKCTPGAINPSITLEVLQNPLFRTECVRNCITSLAEKGATYKRYGIPRPAHNSGEQETCELDHLVPLELGGADSIDNIWPQCGPANVSLPDRYFKEKDMVENFLAAQVKSGDMDLSETQKRIAQDWTPFLADAKRWCSTHRCEGEQ